MNCPVCNAKHNNEMTQALEILACAQRITKKAKSNLGFHNKMRTFIEYLNKEEIQGIEARAFLTEFKDILSNFSNISRSHFSSDRILSEATKMKERILGKRVKSGEIRRPKKMCPVCLKFHFNSAEIPEKCWFRALKGDYTVTYEFNVFLKSNEYGEITL